MRTTPKTVADACKSWLKMCERNELERSTLKAYRSHTGIHIEPKIGRLLLAELSRGDVRDFMDELIDDGASLALVKKIMVSLRAILSEAVEREWASHNVAADIKLKRSSRREGKRTEIPRKQRSGRSFLTHLRPIVLCSSRRYLPECGSQSCVGLHGMLSTLTAQ